MGCRDHVVIAVLSKYVCRFDTANVFNPAALALVATFYLFNTAQDWWGAMPDASPYAVVVLLVTGVFITARVNKLPMVLAFLGVYYGSSRPSPSPRTEAGRGNLQDA